MELVIRQRFPGVADGTYCVKTKGCIAASLYWADSNGALPDWQSFACVPVAPNGVGEFRFQEGRAVPEEATHVLARAVSEDFSVVETCLAHIPKPAERTVEECAQRFLVMTDLHLSNKPWQVRKALAMGKGYDAVLVSGDVTNDGTKEQLERFWSCVTDVLPDTPVYAVTGNHDYPAWPLPNIRDGICDYPALQQNLLDRGAALGYEYWQDESGAYTVAMGDTEIIGLNAATHWRRFKFPENAQLEWLMMHLLKSKAKRHIILCHAPLRLHQPYPPADGQCYLSRDSVLQRILDVERSEVIFISGHTHISMNCRPGCVDRGERKQLYINAGSIRPTTLKPDEPLQPACWTEGNVVELLMGQNQTVVTGISVKTGMKIARGHYRFSRETQTETNESP